MSVKPINESDLRRRVVVGSADCYPWEGTLTGFSEDGSLAKVKCWVWAYWVPSRDIHRVIEHPTVSAATHPYNTMY